MQITALTHAHSGLRYLVIIGIVSLIVHAFQQYSKDDYSMKLHKHAKITAYIFYLNVVLGIVLYLMSSKVAIGPMGLKDTVYRFFTLEHPLMILISLAIMKIGAFRAAKINAKRSNRIVAWSTLIALLILIAGIPWPFREGLVTGWF